MAADREALAEEVLFEGTETVDIEDDNSADEEGVVVSIDKTRSGRFQLGEGQSYRNLDATQIYLNEIGFSLPC